MAKAGPNTRWQEFRAKRKAYLQELEVRRKAGVADGSIVMPEPLPEQTVEAVRRMRRRMDEAFVPTPKD